MLSTTARHDVTSRNSFVEKNARERARSLFDIGTDRELLGPFDRLESPWLPMQGMVPQTDDGCIIMTGTMQGKTSLVISTEGAFLGGSIGEVSGSKICAALELVRQDHEMGRDTKTVLLLESGGVRLQEANLGLAVVAEIMAAVIALRPYTPIVTVITGRVGCFGGMSLVAALSSYIIMTRQARLGLGGPEVIEEEAGVDEFDSRDRALVWATLGGKQRHETGLVDALVEDDVDAIVSSIRTFLSRGVPREYRSASVEFYRQKVSDLGNHQTTWADNSPRDSTLGVTSAPEESRGRAWFRALTGKNCPMNGDPPSVLTADAQVGSESMRFIAIVPDRVGRFHRARRGELGLDEAWAIASRVREAIDLDKAIAPRPIVAIVDVRGPAYGRREESAGLHLAAAAAVDAYASARLNGHPVIALLVGNALSAAYLAHGYQASQIIALDDSGVIVHAMAKEAAARVMRCTVSSFEELGFLIAPLSYRIRDYVKLGLVSKLLSVADPAAAASDSVNSVKQELIAATQRVHRNRRDLLHRLESEDAIRTRHASLAVRSRMKIQWPSR